MLPRTDLSGRIALVTGASGCLGGAFVRMLARQGAAVAAAARRLEPLHDLAGEIGAEGGQAMAVSLDVTDSSSVGEAFDRIESAWGPVGILVNNAGAASRGLSLDLEEGAWRGVIDTNLTGAWLCAREAARRMVRAGIPGSIVNIASILSFRVATGAAPYVAAKAALEHLTGALALEWARHGVRVNALAPGYIASELNREFLAGAAGREMVRRIPQRRLGTAEDLEGPLLLLVSEASRYMTGATVVVDGGHLRAFI